jgi:hypothetical protein
VHDIVQTALKSSDLKGLHAQCLTDIWIGRERSDIIFANPFPKLRLEWSFF